MGCTGGLVHQANSFSNLVPFIPWGIWRMLGVSGIDRLKPIGRFVRKMVWSLGNSMQSTRDTEGVLGSILLSADPS